MRFTLFLPWQVSTLAKHGIDHRQIFPPQLRRVKFIRGSCIWRLPFRSAFHPSWRWQPLDEIWRPWRIPPLWWWSQSTTFSNSRYVRLTRSCKPHYFGIYDSRDRASSFVSFTSRDILCVELIELMLQELKEEYWCINNTMFFSLG